MPDNRFHFLKPMLLFDATWKEEEFQCITNEYPFDDLHVFIQRGDVLGPPLHAQGPSVPGPRPVIRDLQLAREILDIWGIPWSKVPEDAWSTRHIRIEGALFSLAYVRLQVTVYGGLPGDSVLFFMCPTGTSAGIATVHVEVIGEGPESPGQVVARRSSAAESQFVDWYPFKESKDLASFVDSLKRNMNVRVLGLMKTPGVKVRARCTLLGGFQDVYVG